MERLTEKRDGQNVIPLRQNGKIKWSICSAGLGDAPTKYLYGDHADRLAAIEDILGDEYDLGRLKVIMDAERYGGLIVGYPPDDPGPKGPPGCCPNCGRYGGISWDAQTDVSTCALCGWTDAEAALRREQDG